MTWQPMCLSWLGTSEVSGVGRGGSLGTKGLLSFPLCAWIISLRCSSVLAYSNFPLCTHTHTHTHPHTPTHMHTQCTYTHAHTQHAWMWELWYSVFLFNTSNVHSSSDEDHSINHLQEAAVHHQWTGERSWKWRMGWSVKNFLAKVAQVCFFSLIISIYACEFASLSLLPLPHQGFKFVFVFTKWSLTCGAIATQSLTGFHPNFMPTLQLIKVFNNFDWLLFW